MNFSGGRCNIPPHMRFSPENVADAALAAPVVRNLADQLPERERAIVARSADHVYGDLRTGREDWLVVDVYHWGAQHVLFKHEAGRLEYQCNCVACREQAPSPCSHVVIAAVMAVEPLAMDERGALTARATEYPASKLKPLVPYRPVSALLEDGSVQLIRRDGQTVKLPARPVPWQPYFDHLRTANFGPLN